MEQVQKGDIGGLGDWGQSANFVLKDSNWQDLAVELSAQSPSHQ